MTKTIVWRKWVDPVAPLLEGYQQEEDENDPNFQASKDEFGHKRSFRQQTDLTDGSEAWNGPVTVMGGQAVPVHETNLPGQQYDLWMGDANFDLSLPVVKKMSRVQGVETLDVITRYRFRLGVGRAFKSDEVKAEVERALGCNQQERVAAPAKTEVFGLWALASLAKSRFPHWAVVLLADGRHLAIGGQTVDEAKAAVPADGRPLRSSWEG